MSHISLLIRSALSIIVLSSLVFADDNHQEKAQMSGFCGEFIGQVNFIQGRLMQLQQAVPAHKFAWQPTDGVRSLGDVYMHAALANYYFIKMSGQQVPKDINLDLKPHEWDKTATGKEEINKVLERSFHDMIAAAQKISEADLEKTVKVFGMEMSMRNFMVSSLNHLHEHLGQSIAYARSNGITPPWTAEQQKASKQ
jgi:uncharacterized damage-inducible protein DinB